MNFIETKPKGAFEIEAKRIEDEGGMSASPFN